MIDAKTRAVIEMNDRIKGQWTAELASEFLEREDAQDFEVVANALNATIGTVSARELKDATLSRLLREGMAMEVAERIYCLLMTSMLGKGAPGSTLEAERS